MNGKYLPITEHGLNQITVSTEIDKKYPFEPSLGIKRVEQRKIS